MKEEDKNENCKAMQDIETDLFFGYIEAYQAGRMREIMKYLTKLERHVKVMEKVCKNSH